MTPTPDRWLSQAQIDARTNYTAVHDAYRAAPEAERDEMLVGALLRFLFRELI